ncbi:MAG: hypothetical protein A2063_05405 [Gallionellales bacterium GWA2_60_142]|nr:MAG: hypothetical protein A2063_05405 [Gallionellales bacterium GWA2_60_142]
MRSSGFLPRLAAGLLLVNLCVAVLAAWSMWQNFRIHEEQAELATQNLARALESDLAGAIRTDEMALHSVLDELYRQRAAGRVDAQALNFYIERVRERLPEIDAIRITDAQGVLLYGTGVNSQERKSLADRPHFIRLRDDPAANLAFSKPQISRVNDKLVQVLAHRIERADGAFDGMVFAAIPLDYLARTFSTLDIGKNGMVALRDADLELVVRYPESGLSELAVGGKMPPSELSQFAASGMTAGSYTATSLADGIGRMISFRKLPNYPFYIQVGWARDDYLAATRQEAKELAVLVVLFVLLTLVAGGLILRTWQGQRRINRALAESETRLNELFENMSSGVAIYRVDEEGKRFVFDAFNRAAERIEKMSRGEVIGREVIDVFPGIEKLGLLEVFRRVWQTGKSEHFPLSLYRDGRVTGWRDNFVYKLPGGEIVAIYDDVTERIRAEESLRLSEERYRATFDHAAVGIAQVATDGRFLEINSVFCDIIGYTREEVLSQGFTFQQITLPEDLAPDMAQVQRLLDGADNQYAMEKRYVRKDGCVVWVSLSVALLRDEAGKPLHFISSVADITERKQAEQTVRFSMEKLNEAQRIAQVGNWDLDLGGGYLYWSDEIFNLFEIDKEMFAASYEAFLNAIHPDDRDRVNQAYTRSLETRQPYEIMHRLLMADGRVKWVNERCETFYDAQGKALRSVGTVQDITLRKQAEEALAQNELLLRTIFNTLPVGVWVTDAQGTIRLGNEASQRIWAGSRYVGLKQYGEYRGWWHDSGKPIAPEEWALARAVTRGEVSLNELVDIQCFDGARKTILNSAMPLRNDEQEIAGAIVVIQDITDRIESEMELKEKSEALQRSNSDLERFAYSVSHDMRQPLRAVSGHLQLLQRSMKNKLDDDERENMNFALEGAKRMDSMIVSLLDYSRVGRKTEAKALMPAREALEDAMGFLGPMMHDSEAEVSVAGEWPQVYASRDELTRLFQNLIGNALHYHEQDQAPRVEIESSIGERQWRVMVRDHGIGIDPAQLDRLFQFFSRLQSRARFEGTGMGLALCRRIVEHHGGRIWAESEGEGRGSTFSFELPLTAMEEGKTDA